VLRELAQNPFLDFEPVSAGVTQSDQVGDQARQRALSLNPPHNLVEGVDRGIGASDRW